MADRIQQLNDIREMVDWLEDHPNVPLPSSRMLEWPLWLFSDKDVFLRTATAFGSFEKRIEGGELVIIKRFGTASLTASVQRSTVCTKRTVIKQMEVEEWDCEPLLSAAELASLEAV